MLFIPAMACLPQRKAFKFSLCLTRLDYCPRGNWGIGSHFFLGRMTQRVKFRTQTELS
jgi:hypothetical protein